MKRTLFVFGRTPDLSFLELQSFFPSATRLSSDIALLNESVDSQALIRNLGGTVKIASVIHEASAVTVETLVSLLGSAVTQKKLVFGVHVIGKSNLSPKIFHEVKEALEVRGVHTRYVQAKHEGGLSSVVIAKQQVTELVIVPVNDIYLFAVTEAVQEFEQWNARDWLRPAPDPKHGMLPPKVARMIVNIALSGASVDHPMLYDPFCGVGTILQEGLLSGANCTGSDVSSEAISRAKKNLDWLRIKYPEIAPLYINLFVADATHVGEYMAPNSVDAIATEPFLGDTKMGKEGVFLPPAQIKNSIKGLEKLYIGCLREWTAVLKPHAKVVIAFPAYVTRHGLITVKTVVDRCESLGYTLFTGPIEYSRPQAVVRREFYIFEKKE